MNWRPEGWYNPYITTTGGVYTEEPWHRVYEAGADAYGEALKPLLGTIYAQLVDIRINEIIYAQLLGIGIKEGGTSWCSDLDSSIDKLGVILGRNRKEEQ